MKSKKKRRKQKPQPRIEPFWVRHRSLLIVLVVGLLLRIIYDLNLAGSIIWGNYLLDSQAYQTWALDIMNGVKMDTAFFRAPLYPYTMALLYSLFGVSPWPVVVFQNLLGLLTVVVTYRFATGIFGSKQALWAAAVVAVYPTLIFFEGETLMTTLTTFLYLSAGYRIYRAAESPDTRNVLTAGLVLGLAAITRPAILPLAVLLPIALLLKTGWSNLKTVLRPVVWMLVGVALPIFPVTAANVINGGEFVLIATQGGVNFYIGNNSEADGITVISPGPMTQMGKFKGSVVVASVDEAERRSGRKMSPGEASSFWFSETFREMAQQPLAAAARMVRKFYLFWHGQEILNNRSLYYSAEYSPLMRPALWKHGLSFPTGLLIPLMFVGFYFGRRDGVNLFVPLAYVLGLGLIVASFFVCSRFRQPILPVAAVFGVYAVYGGVRAWSNDRRRVWVGLSVFMLLVVGLNWGGNIESRINQSLFEGFLGSSFHNRGEYEEAIVHFEEALRLAPDNMQLYENLGKAYMKTEQYDRAKKVYEAGLQRFPVYPHYNFNLGRIAQMNNDIEGAKQYFRTTIEYAPDFAPGYDRLGYILDGEGKLDSALYYYEGLQRLRPTDTRLLAKINQLRQALGIEP